MKHTNFKIVLSLVMLASIFSCVNDDKYTDEGISVKTYELVANKTVAEVNATANVAIPTLYTADDIIEAYVTSSDETGNFFSTISFQTLPTAGIKPIGFSVSADFKSFGHGFTPGRKVFIKLKDLYVAQIDGSLKIGALFVDNGVNEIGRISTFNWDKHLFPSNIIVPEEQLITTSTVATLNSPTNLNILTEIDNVQFSDDALGRTLFDIDSGGGATNHVIVGVGTSSSSVLRTSSFSTFSRSTVPAGRGKIRGVLNRFGTTYQFYVRTLNDFKLESPRVYTFSNSLNEGFQSFTNNQRIFPNYLNFSPIGTKEWQVRTGNHLEMSAFGGAAERNKSYFLIPINMAAASTFTFQVRIQFYSNRTGLKVYRCMDYVPGMKISDATLFDISSSFSVPSASTTTFANAGTYNIPATVTGNGFFVFEYTGTSISAEPLVTTTVQIDNIVVN